jgi:hypothetical protein
MVVGVQRIPYSATAPRFCAMLAFVAHQRVITSASLKCSAVATSAVTAWRASRASKGCRKSRDHAYKSWQGPHSIYPMAGKPFKPYLGLTDELASTLCDGCARTILLHALAPGLLPSSNMRGRGVKLSASHSDSGAVGGGGVGTSYPLTNVLMSVAVACAGAFGVSGAHD